MMDQRKLAKELDVILKRLDDIELLMAFMVRANQRFKEGQRVRFSHLADRRGISAGRKHGVRTGTVIEAGDGFTVKLKLDGYRRAFNIHHAFIERNTPGRPRARK